MRTRFRLKALLAACAMAGGALTMTGVQPAAAATCVPTMLIGVHGTGEETGVIGNELATLYNGVVAHTGLPEQGLNGWSDDSSLMTDLAAAAAVWLVDGDVTAFASAISKLQAAVNAGETDLYNQVTSEESSCPGERFVIAGFSQGAMVVDQFARDHPSLSANSGGPVSGVVLWADPEFNGDDLPSMGADPGASGFISTSGWLGVIGWYYNKRYTFPSAWSGRLRSYCTSDDGVCDWNPINAPKIATRHGDENQTPAITSNSDSAIQASGSGWAPSVWDTSSGSYYTVWQNHGGVGGTLGHPASDPVSKPNGGMQQSFAGASCGSGSAILWSPSSGTHAMWGCLYNAFVHQYGGPGGAYGYPTTDEENTAGGGGRVNHMTGTSCGTVHGSGIYWSSAGGFPVHGCIYQRYEQIGEDSSGLGLPTSDEYAVSGGVEQNYSHGYIRDIGGSITVTYFSGLNLDNTDPYATGCAGSAHPETYLLSTKDGPTVIDLQWSNFCGTNWARVYPNITSTDGSITMAIWVERLESNGSITSGDHYQFQPGGSLPAWSDQLYAPTRPARACENYWTRYDKVWSTPVCTAWG